jgi:hypothetical protein
MRINLSKTSFLRARKGVRGSVYIILYIFKASFVDSVSRCAFLFLTRKMLRS